MFEKIKGFSIKSGIFEDKTQLELFEGNFEGTNQSQNDRASLLFGRNGSGKSTIARGISKYKNSEWGVDRVSFIDKDNNNIVLSDSERKSIFIFNEDYIDQKVRIAQEGLDTIVILGEQVDIDSQLVILRSKLAELRSEFQRYDSEYTDYKDDKNEKSPDFWKKRMTNSLKGPGNWAERDREIKGNRAASSVNSNTFQNFVNLQPTLDRDLLENKFNEEKVRYFSIRESAVAINHNLSLPPINFDRNELSTLLSQRIEKPELNDRDEYLLTLLSDTTKGERHLKEVKDFFSDEHQKRCPFCTQLVSDDIREELINGVTKLLSRAVEEHQQALRGSKIDEINQNFSDYKQIDSSLIDSYQSSINALNAKFNAINLLIDKKIENPYVVVELPELDFSKELSQVESDIEKINQAVTQHNSEIIDNQTLKENLLRINNELAFYEIQDDYKKFQEKSTEKEACKSNYDSSKSKVSDYEQQISNLENQKLNIDIAVDEINKGLNYIFFSKDRLAIQNQNGKYYLLSRGKAVDPSRVSVGERNALALCYFFTEIIQQRELSEAYSQENFIIIDDPVSSFDMENKVGIISYLKFCLTKFLKGNRNTRVLLMTHDKQTMYDFDKFLQEVMESCKVEEGGQKSKYKKLELVSGKLQEFKTSSHDYTELLEIVFDFASGRGGPTVETFVGNAMRKILEAYGSFNYKTGITQLTTDQKIVAKLDERYRSYFENLMYRLVLHGGSHYEDPVKALNIDFFDTISDEEREKTARDLLVLLYLLDDLHILKHLAGISDAKEELEQWKHEILE
ncbi:AAA family ATPase [Streptococcus gallolyticus]|nr:AAA family ATPase [Streptococcus gallolyticus]MBY5041622.1 AAA family ATPase [Streptococcus gallolyticus]